MIQRSHHRLVVFLILIWKFSASQSSGMNNELRYLIEETAGNYLKVPLLVQGNIQKLLTLNDPANLEINYYYDNIASVKCNVQIVPGLLQSGIISFAEYIKPHKELLNDTMIYRNRIKAVKLWTAPLPRAYNGEGVIMGIIDSGLDFTHPDFKDSSGKSRVLYLWDQKQTSGSTKPLPYNYGIEWNTTQINNNQCTHSDLTHFGHGTHVSGIAAGNGLANGRNQGVASKSDLVVVALDFNNPGPNTADALHYIFTKASGLGKPCVVNASVGDYYGSHDATDLEAKLIENMLKNVPGRSLVAAVGNAGHIRFHVKSEPPPGDTVFTWLKSGGSHYYWCHADTNQVSGIKFSFGANRLSFGNIGQTPFRKYNFAIGQIKRDTLKNQSGQRIGVVNLSASINNYGVYELSANIVSDSANVYWRIESTGKGLHHAWNFNFLSTGLPSPTQYPRISKHAMPDTMYSIVSSFQCSEEVITVGNYVNLTNYYDVNNQVQPSGQKGGEIAFSSSSGPTRTGLIKPDITAGGQTILSCMALGMKANLLSNAPTAVGQGSMHVIGGGSSAASPIVAGLAALYLQKNPTATNRQVRDAIRYCAYADNFTGTQLPDYRWGFGKLDGKATMSCGQGNPMVGLNSPGINNTLLSYPNPFTEKFSINTAELINASLFIYSASGLLVYQTEITNATTEIKSSDLEDTREGIFLVRILKGSQSFNFKIIKTSSR